MRLNHRATVAVVACALSLFGTRAIADPVADFYHNKTITVVSGGAPGALYDFNARLIGRYLAAHMPGHPSAVIQDMPGASSITATQYVYNIAAHDGLTLLVAQPYVVLDKMLKPALKYEPTKFTWIGRIAPLVQFGVVRTDTGTRTVVDLMHKKVVFGAGGASGPAAMIPWILNRTVGTKISVVVGYKNAAAYLLAMINGEIQGLGSVDISDLARHPELTAQKQIQYLYFIGLERDPKLPEVPAIVELDKGKGEWSPLRLLASVPTLGLNVIGPPGVPAERLAALRKAFDEMVRDPEFIADAGKLKIEVDPMDGQKLEQIVKAAFSAPQNAIDKLRQFSKPPG